MKHQPRARRLPLLLVLTAVVGAPTVAWPQEVRLAWKYEPGTDLTYRMVVETETELGPPMPSITMTMDILMGLLVEDVTEEGHTTIRLTTERVRAVVDGPMGTMSVDSEDEASTGGPLDSFVAMAGLGYTVVTDAQGDLIEISGLEEMQEALRAQSTGAPGMMGPDQILDEAALRGQWEQGFGKLPEEAVGVGSTWESSFSLPLPGGDPVTIGTTHEVVSVEGGIVEFTESGGMAASEGPAAPASLPVRIETLESTGSTRFDASRGLLLGTEGTVTVAMVGEMAGRETNMGMVMRTTLELIEE